ncbi:MAG: RidA family protein, partial [Cytophagales bacterium]
MKTPVAFAVLFLITTVGLGQRVNFDKKLKEVGVELYAPGKPMGNYVKAVRTGNLIYLAGHGPTKADGSNITGKLGKDLTTEQGYDAAKQTGIAILST